MAVVVRLQGLPVVAGSSDIRRFFSGLNIPDGGVHILGGEKGDAFIIFETDEDARQAMSYSGGYIKGSRIEFFLSSKIELQSIIKNISKRVDRSGRETGATRWTGFSNSGVGSHSNVGAPVNKQIGISNYDSTDLLEDSFCSNGSQSSNTDLSKSSYQPREESLMSDNLHLYICGMPYSATEDDVITFFAGLQVDGVIMFKTDGVNNGAGLVKFATPSDAMKGLQRDREYMGKRFIEIRRSNKGEWNKNSGRVGGRIDHPCSNEQFAHDFNKDSSFPSREYTRGDPDYSSLKKHTHTRSPPRIMTDPLEDRFNSNGSQSSNTDLSKSSCQRKEESLMSDNLYLYIRGMPYSATEDDVITFFAGLQVDGVIMFKTNGQNNGAGLVKFATLSDAMKGLQRDREYMGERFIEIRRSIEGTWIKYNGRIGKKDRPFSNGQFAHDLNKKSSISSKERTRRDPDYSYSRRHTHSRSPPRIMTHTHSRSPPRRTEAHTSSRSPLRRVMVRTRSRSPPTNTILAQPNRKQPPLREGKQHSLKVKIQISSNLGNGKKCQKEKKRWPTYLWLYPPQVKLISQTLSGLPRRNRWFLLWVELRMAVVVRLQGLPVVAGSSDIRRFFSGWNIPYGGVHIIGGEKGEAFIIFATDEDARQAMSYSGGYIKGSRVEFFLSSKTEMQNIIESSRKRVDHSRRETAESRWTGFSNSGVDNLSNLDAPINRGFGTCDSMDPLEDSFHSNGSQSSNTDLSKSSYNQPRKEPHRSDNLYLYICGMPYSATKDDIVTFFAGLQVDGVIMFKTYGRNNGAGVVKFATPSDAREGLLRDNEYMGGRFIKVRRSTEGTWIKNGGNIWGKDHYISNEQFAHDLNKESSTSSKERTRRDPDYSYSRRHTHSRSPPRIMTHTHSRSPPRRTEAHTSSRSPLRRVMVRTRSRSPPKVLIATVLKNSKIPQY
ncbi:hypothetical protein JD844_015957 [Phrynosoma platyrhinos]|uniref:RRM domain-containing protein n=1 Tax=Phrynosoma platyrhinos TaxID=52577 RepID=A0ABQ7SJZ2_PHRPL|nr:hypothetical protein JD844_015957 [Phrynosoma platyrhinos]